MQKLILSLVAIAGLMLGVAINLSTQAHAVGHLTELDRDHSQLAFCFGGYSVLYHAALTSENDNLSSQLSNIQDNLVARMRAIESFIKTFEGPVWAALIPVAQRSQFRAGIKYIDKVGPVGFKPEMDKCRAILSS